MRKTGSCPQMPSWLGRRGVFLAMAMIPGILLVPPDRGTAQTPHAALEEPTAPAPNASPQTPDLAELDAYMARAVEDWGVPGMAVAIVKDGEVVLAEGYGVRHVEEGGEVDEHTLFAIASNTKAFTAAALAVLVDEGKLSWDDRVRDHLPWFQLYDPFVSDDMRIRDLLSHRSGLGTFSGDLLWYGTDYSAEEVLRRARYLPAAGPFRAHYGYSNLMFLAAGEVLRAVSGRDWVEFVEERFFGPLGMERTVASTDSLPSRENVATPHGMWEGELVAFPWYNWDAMAAAGGIISSVADMARWLELQLGRGELDGGRYFSEEQSWEMWSVHTPIRVSPGSRRRIPSTHFQAYGLGWSLMDYRGRKVVSHGGGYDGMFSRVALVPEESLGLVILTNSMTGISRALSYRILDGYLGGPERDWSREGLERERAHRRRVEAMRSRADRQRIRGTEPSLELDGYTGTYGGEMYGDATVTLEDGGLVLRLLPNPDLVADLTHLHYDTFRLRWRRPWPWFGPGTAHFVLDASGQAAEIRLDVPNEDLWFHELELVRKE